MDVNVYVAGKGATNSMIGTDAYANVVGQPETNRTIGMDADANVVGKSGTNSTIGTAVNVRGVVERDMNGLGVPVRYVGRLNTSGFMYRNTTVKY